MVKRSCVPWRIAWGILLSVGSCDPACRKLRWSLATAVIENFSDEKSVNMQVEKIVCNSCAAPLEVSTTTQFATCRHCGTKLSIQRTETATFTEVLEGLTAKTDQLSEQVNSLAGFTELAALDREWELERQNYMVSTRNGARHIPSQAGSIGGGIAITIFGCFWTVLAQTITSFIPVLNIVFPLFGVVFVIVGIASSISSYTKAGGYRQAEQRYRQRRVEIQNRVR